MFAPHLASYTISTRIPPCGGSNIKKWCLNNSCRIASQFPYMYFHRSSKWGLLWTRVKRILQRRVLSAVIWVFIRFFRVLRWIQVWKNIMWERVLLNNSTHGTPRNSDLKYTLSNVWHYPYTVGNQNPWLEGFVVRRSRRNTRTRIRNSLVDFNSPISPY